MRLAEVGRHGARMDGAELQMRRHPAGGGQVRPVAVLGVVLESLLRERFPLTPGRALARGQLQLDSEVGDVHPAGNVLRIDPLCGFRAGRRRVPPAVPAPRVVERREHFVGRAVVLGHPSRRHQVGRSRLLERHPVPDPAEHVAYRVVAPAAERGVVRGHVHRRRHRSPSPAQEFVSPDGHGSPAVARRGCRAGRAVRRRGTATGAAPTMPSAVDPGHSRRAPRRRSPRRRAGRAGRAAADRVGTTTVRACH